MRESRHRSLDCTAILNTIGIHSLSNWDQFNLCIHSTHKLLDSAIHIPSDTQIRHHIQCGRGNGIVCSNPNMHSLSTLCCSQCLSMCLPAVNMQHDQYHQTNDHQHDHDHHQNIDHYQLGIRVPSLCILMITISCFGM